MDEPSTSRSGVGRQIALNGNGKRTTNARPSYAAETCKRDVLRQYRIGKRDDDECTLWYRRPASWTAEMADYYTTIDESRRNFDCCATVLGKMRERRGRSASDWTAAPICDVRALVGHGCRKRKRRRRDVCAMCGNEGHDQNDCDRSMCLSCGARRPEFVDACECCEPRRRCTTGCSAYGHGPKRCPDNWRRFHDITSTAAGRDAPAPPSVQQWTPSD